MLKMWLQTSQESVLEKVAGNRKESMREKEQEKEMKVCKKCSNKLGKK